MSNVIDELPLLNNEPHAEITITDPVCGRRFGLAEAVAHEEESGWAYFFCSAHCHQRFVASPDRYLGNRANEPDRHRLGG